MISDIAQAPFDTIVTPQPRPAQSGGDIRTLTGLLDYLDSSNGPVPLDQLTKILSNIGDCRAEALSFARFGPHVYMRNTVRAGKHYEALVLCWLPGQSSPVHDHTGASCAVMVLEGEATEVRYERGSDGKLRAQTRQRVPAGSIIGSSDADVHVMANWSNPRRNLITLHIYTPNIRGMKFYPQDEIERVPEDGIQELPAAAPRWKHTPIQVSDAVAPTIAIIGGGFSGTITAAQILRSAAQPLRVLLYDTEGRFGPGVAYGTVSGQHLLNVPASGMTALEDEPAHFLNWLKKRDIAADAETFARRQLYGEYLKELIDTTHRTCARDVKLEFSCDEVVDLSICGEEKVELICKSGARQIADNVVLATGNSAPLDPPVPNMSFYSTARYLRNPWALKRLDGIGKDDTILLIGTGLTMVDVVLELMHRGHSGILHAVSRRGLLPRVHTPIAPPAPADMVQGVVREKTALGMLRELRKAVDLAAKQEIEWRRVIGALRPITPKLWQQLSHKERVRFMRFLRPFWDVHRHRLPQQLDAKIRTLMAQDKLQIHRARIGNLEESDNRVNITLQPPGGEELVLGADWVINCTGPASDVRKIEAPITKRLLEMGLIVPDPLAIGVLTDDNGAAIDSGGHASSWLFTIGALRRPQLWESTAVPELRKQARMLSQRVLPQLHFAYSL